MQNVEILVQEKIESILDKIEKIYNKRFPTPTIRYTLKSTIAGKAYCIENMVDFNKTFLLENTEKFIAQTVTHELAHILACKIYGTIGHDKYWKHIMCQLGAEPTRCHNYSIKNVKTRKTKTVPYKCGCSQHNITTNRHNKILKTGARYRCNSCKQVIVAI